MHGHGKIGKVPVSDTYTARSDTDTNVSNMHPAKNFVFLFRARHGHGRTRQSKKKRERTVEKTWHSFRRSKDRRPTTAVRL